MKKILVIKFPHGPLECRDSGDRGAILSAVTRRQEVHSPSPLAS